MQGNCKVSIVNSKDEDAMIVEVEYSEELRKYIKENMVAKATIEVEYKAQESSEKSFKFDRYRVKLGIISACTRNERDIIFAKELLDTGKVRINFDSFKRVESLSENIQQTLSEAIAEYQKIQGYEYKIEIKTE